MSNLLRDALLSASSTGLGVYALIDPSLLDESARKMVSRPSSSLAATAVSVVPEGMGLTGENALNVLPYLLDLASPTLRESLLERTVEWAIEWHASTWLATSIEPTRLAALLASRMDIRLPQQQAALLRFSDARILPSVHRLMSDEERAGFFAPVTRWWYFDRAEVLCELNIARPAAAGDWPAPWQLTDAQETALLECAAPDAVLALLHRLAPVDLAALPRHSRHAFVARQITSAKRWDIDAENQQALFCLAAMVLGEGFEEQGAWSGALAQVKAGAWDMNQAIAAATQPKSAQA